jgi:ribonuclease D
MTTDEPPGTDAHREPLEPPAVPAARIVERAEDLVPIARALASEPLVALDSESNSMHAYRERTCIVQLTAGGLDAIVDVLALQDMAPLRDALDREDVDVVLHGGDYDISVLTRDHDFRFHRVFDTMIAATLLGDERVGLADLVRDHFGVDLDKRFQRADWSRRPLTAEQIDYLMKDTIYLLPLREHYRDRLIRADLWEEAEIEFRRLAGRRGAHAAPNADGWRRIKGAERLDPRGRAVLAAMHRWREHVAEQRDLPPFKVLSPHTMRALAEAVPEQIAGPRDLPVLRGRDHARYARALVPVVREGLQAAREGRAPPRSLRQRPTPEDARAARERRRIEDAVRAWRREEARRRGVPTTVVLPNPALAWLLDERPRDVPALEASPDIGPKRIARYGATLVSLLHA